MEPENDKSSKMAPPTSSQPGFKKKNERNRPGYSFQNPKWNLQDTFLVHYKLLPTRLRRCEITPNDIEDTMKIDNRYLDEKRRETKVYKFIENLVDIKMQ